MQNLHTQSNGVTDISGYKLFSAGQIAAGTFFGTIFTGGYILAENYYRLNETKRGNSRIFRSVFYFLIYVLSAVIFSELPKGTDGLWLWVLIGFIFVYKSEFKRKQADKFTEHLAHGGEKYSNWFVALLCLLSLAAYFAIALFALYFLEIAGF